MHPLWVGSLRNLLKFFALFLHSGVGISVCLLKKDKKLKVL